MKVLLLGATGNLGTRLIPALLTHNHQVVAYVRSSSKLQGILPPDVFRRISVVEGDAMDSNAVKRAILDNQCDAVISAAGVAALAPWGKTDLPKIFRAIVDGIQQAMVERGRPMRVWFMGGLSVLHFPGTETMLSNYIPIYLAHRQNLALLKALPPNTMNWSMLCPSDLTEESSDFSVPTKASSNRNLVANAVTPPNWQDSWLKHIPLIGRMAVCGMNASRYVTSLEQVAEFITDDLASDETRWSNTTVGVIEASK